MPGPYRTEFWESWLWQTLTIPPSGRYALEVTVPHSTTSWCITGFSIDPKYGLGIVKKRITFSAAKIFFILDHLPRTIKRYETVSLHFTLLSSIGEEFEANVTMFNAMNQMHFIGRPGAVAKDTKTVSVPPNSDAPVLFLIKAMKLGELEIRVNASIMQGVISDSFKKIIVVLPEDVLLLKSQRIHFDDDTPSNQSFDIPLFIDETSKDDAIPVDLTVYPDQQSLKDLQNNYNVSIFHDTIEKSMHVNSDFNENITIKSVPNNTRTLTAIVKSLGSGVIQINWQYRLNLMHFMPRFDLQLTKLTTPSEWMKELFICLSFIPEDRDDHSNGTLVEVSIPIGYSMENHSVVELKTTINPISRIEILHGGTTVLVHYNHIGNETNCFSVFVYRRFKMRERHPSYIKVQDTYRPELNAIIMFDCHELI
ncbi:alpha-1-inhibitor 3-like [Anopheles aquasalis]|uniref:alpha-1-inhibitor 3-like n=1 Tax=Anopheles aquasalis TaxID=42839 RepID=UPI00215AE346|nr:alpha-1-inhibitor 3-like [Anopheles aquasalis]